LSITETAFCPAHSAIAVVFAQTNWLHPLYLDGGYQIGAALGRKM
jgi:hypothetical protein